VNRSTSKQHPFVLFRVRTRRLIPLAAAALALGTAAAASAQPARPIVLVGPTFQSQADLDASAAWLRDPPYNYTVAAVALQGEYPGTASMADSAVAVGYAVEELLYRTGAEQVDLIAYSQGAPVARYFIENYEPARELIAGLISLGGVNYGIPRRSGIRWFDRLVRLGCQAQRDGGPRYPVCNEIFYNRAPGDTAFLMELNEPDPTPWDDEIDYYHIYTESEERPGSGETIELPGATSVSVQQACDDHPVQHVSLFTDAVVRSMIIAALEGTLEPDACP
jgi:triacylglycerol lipase